MTDELAPVLGGDARVLGRPLHCGPTPEGSLGELVVRLTLLLSEGFSWKDNVTVLSVSTPQLPLAGQVFSPFLRTIIIWTVLDVTRSVSHALAFTVLPSVLWDRVVTFPHRILNASATGSRAVSPGSPQPPASMNGSLNGDTSHQR